MRAIGAAVFDEPPQSYRVHVHHVEVEKDRVTVDVQTPELRRGESGPERRQGHPEVIARLCLTSFRPKESSQRLARARSAGGQCQTRQDRPCLLEGERQWSPGGSHAGREATEQDEPEPRTGSLGPMVNRSATVSRSPVARAPERRVTVSVADS